MSVRPQGDCKKACCSMSQHSERAFAANLGCVQTPCKHEVGHVGDANGQQEMARLLASELGKPFASNICMPGIGEACWHWQSHSRLHEQMHACGSTIKQGSVKTMSCPDTGVKAV